MNEYEPRKVIVVLGAGRCGTSLLMQVLSSLGMSLSEKLVSARAHNVMGPMEDSEIAKQYDELLEQIGSNRLLPINKSMFPTGIQNKTIRVFKNILQKNLNGKRSIWGFKDPYTSNLLPFWFQAFNSMSVVPVFLLAVRHPAQSVLSREKHFGTAKETGELAWLVNFTDALRHTSADCYIVHYEDWFSRPQELAQELLGYTGLNEVFTGDVCDAVRGVIKPNLNRAVYNEYSIKNECVRNLYDVLSDCCGAEFERERVMAVVKECRANIDGFKGWALEAQKHLKQKESLQEEVSNSEINEVILRKEIEEKTTQIGILKRKNCRAVIQKRKIRKEFNRALAKIEKKIIVLQTSYSFCFGKLLVEAFTKPGKNTVLFPFRFVKLILKFMVVGINK